MRASRIDFAPPSLRRVVRRSAPQAWLLGAAGLAICAAVAWQTMALVQELALAREAVRQAEAQLSLRVPARAQESAPAIAPAQANAVNAAIRRLNVPWRDLFDALEDATPPTIALLALEPDAQKRLLKAEAEARTPGDMIAYIEVLKRQEVFRMLRFTRHETATQDPGKPIRFQFEASWAEPPP